MKLASSYFKNLLLSCDILVLTETHLAEGRAAQIPIPADFAYIESCRPNENLHTSRGGILVLHRKTVKVSLSETPLTIENPDLLWVNVGDTTLGCKYLRLEPTLQIQWIHSEAGLLAHVGNSNSKVIAIGDTNARGGLSQSVGLPRVCQDPTYKDRGPQLI